MLREEDRHFLWSMYSAAAIIFAWKGVWEGIYELPVIRDFVNTEFIFLFLGLTMLTFSGLVFKEFDPLGGMEKALVDRFEKIMTTHKKTNFSLSIMINNKRNKLTCQLFLFLSLRGLRW